VLDQFAAPRDDALAETGLRPGSLVAGLRLRYRRCCAPSEEVSPGKATGARASDTDDVIEPGILLAENADAVLEDTLGACSAERLVSRTAPEASMAGSVFVSVSV
jgi:hypothetical protein